MLDTLKHLGSYCIKSCSSIIYVAIKFKRKFYFDSGTLSPRVIKNQKHGGNYDCNPLEEYYRAFIFERLIFNPENRFIEHNVVLSFIEILVSKFALNKNVSKFEIFNIFHEDWVS